MNRTAGSLTKADFARNSHCSRNGFRRYEYPARFTVPESTSGSSEIWIWGREAKIRARKGRQTEARHYHDALLPETSSLPHILKGHAALRCVRTLSIFKHSRHCVRGQVKRVRFYKLSDVFRGDVGLQGAPVTLQPIRR